MFLKNRNIISKIKRSKVTDYAALNEVYVSSIKYRYSDILLKKHKLHLFCLLNFRIIRIIDFNRAEPACYRTNFHCAISCEQNGAFWYILLRVMLLTYIRAMICFSNCGNLIKTRSSHNVISKIVSPQYLL